MHTFLTRKEFAEELEASIATIVRGIKGDKWPFNGYVRIGSRIRYPATILDEIKSRANKKEGQE